MTDATMPGTDNQDRERKPEESAEENPFTDAELDLSDFGENPDTETTG